MAEHNVFGSDPPPWALTGFDNGSPITTANAFYATTTTWYCVGARLYVPAGAPFPGTVTLGLRTAAYETLVDLSAAPLASGVATVATGWCEARWAPVEVPPVTVMWPSLEDGSVYVYGEPPGTDPVRAVDMADLYLAEAGMQPRAAYRIGGDVTTASPAHYGFGLLVTDDPDGGGTVWEISGLAPGVSAVEGAVSAQRAVAGLVPVVSGAVGAVTARRNVAGSAAAVSTAFGSVVLADALDPLPADGVLTPRAVARTLTPTTPSRRLEPR